MKRSFVVALALIFGLIAAPAVSFAEDSALDKAGDWVVTLGKSQDEKDRIIMERRARRAMKDFEKGVDRAGKDIEKAFK